MLLFLTVSILMIFLVLVGAVFWTPMFPYYGWGGPIYVYEDDWY